MKVQSPARFILPLVAFMLAAVAPAAVRAQDARSALTNFPESQAVLYLNARRLVNEVAPGIVPREQLDKAFARVKPLIDVNGLEYVIAGVRLKGDLSAKQLPEFLLIMRGNFSADALLSGARMMEQDMYTRETVGAKTIDIFTLNRPAPADAAGGEQKKKFPFDQIAAVALDANTLAVGIPAYVRDAVDTSGGRPRLKPELVDLAVRDANTLISLAADIPPGISQQMSAMGAPMKAEVQRMIDAVRQVQLAVNMQPSTFGVQSIMRMEDAEKASTLSGLINLSVGFLKDKLQKDLAKVTDSSKDGTASTLKVLNTLTNTARGSEVELNIAFQRAALTEMVNRMFAAKKEEPAVAAPGVKKDADVKRRPARRRRR